MVGDLLPQFDGDLCKDGESIYFPRMVVIMYFPGLVLEYLLLVGFIHEEFEICNPLLGLLGHVSYNI
eukprot:10093909-Ditylum_brightwellii.AAC.1